MLKEEKYMHRRKKLRKKVQYVNFEYFWVVVELWWFLKTSFCFSVVFNIKDAPFDFKKVIKIALCSAWWTALVSVYIDLCLSS